MVEFQRLNRSYAQVYSSIYEAGTTDLTDKRMNMAVFRLDGAGAPTREPLAFFSDFLLQNIREEEKEKYQFMESSDSNKIFSFGKDHVMFSLTGELIDTNTGTLSLGGDEYSGRSYKEFSTFVEDFANVGTCARNGQLAALSYANRVIYGGFANMSASFNAMEPHKVSVSCLFVVVRQDIAGVN